MLIFVGFCITFGFFEEPLELAQPLAAWLTLQFRLSQLLNLRPSTDDLRAPLGGALTDEEGNPSFVLFDSEDDA